MQPQIEKPGKSFLRIVPRSSDRKFRKIWSRGCGEMASDGRMNRHKHSMELYAPLKFFREHTNLVKWALTFH